MRFRPYQPTGELKTHQGNLPHWRQDQVTYFITARLADSLPKIKLIHWQRERSHWLHNHQAKTSSELPEELRDQYRKKFTKPWHDWLDAGSGECHLRHPEPRELLITQMGKTAPDALDFWVIMPNHIHALVTPPPSQTLGKLMQHWKGGSAHAINKLLGKRGTMWQKESYDHIVRSEEQYWHFLHYITNNPIKARLKDSNYSIGVGHEIAESAQELKARYWG